MAYRTIRRWEYWRHCRSRQVWAIRLDSDNRVTGAYEVLDFENRAVGDLPDFAYDSLCADWIDKHRDVFEPLRPAQAGVRGVLTKALGPQGGLT